jgi:transketolase
MRLFSTVKVVVFSCVLFTSYSTYSQQLPEVKKVAVHQVDQQVYAHTFKTNSQSMTSYSDEQAIRSSTEEIDGFIKLVLTINGVTEASFDLATSTFTIISSKESIEEEIERLTQQK